MSVQEKMTAIADAIREKTEGTEPLTLDDMAASVQEVYDKGQGAGYDEGSKSEYDAFWDGFQDYGNRTSYVGGFYGDGWTAQTFRPKYDIKPTEANSMFQHTYGLVNVDMVEHLKGLGVILDFSNATSLNYTFSLSRAKRWGVIDTRKCTSLFYTFDQGYNYLQTIDKIILKDDGSQTFDNAFRYVYQLKEVRFEGVVGQNGLNLSGTKVLSKDSFKSLVNALSATETGKTVTLSNVAKQSAFTAEEWAVLIATKPNWTFSLI